MTQVADPSVNLFCDSLQVLDEVSNSVDLDAINIWSSSPAMIDQTRFKVWNLDEGHSPQTLDAIYRASCRIADSILADRVRVESSLGENAGQLLAFAALRLQPHMVKALSISALRFNRPAIVTMPQVAPDPDGRFSGNLLSDLLQQRSGVEYLSVSVSRRSDGGIAPRSPGILTRLRGATGSTLRYRLRGILDKRRRPAGRMAIFTLGENELLKETASHLQSLGFRVIPARRAVNASIDHGSRFSSVDIQAALPPGILEQLSIIAPTELREAVFRVFLRKAEEALREHAGHIAAFRPAFADWQERPLAVLANISAPVRLLAMRLAAREAKVPVYGFQHGVTDEISARGSDRHSVHEVRLVDHLFVFNREAEATAKAAVGNDAAVSVVGLPADYRRAGRSLAGGHSLSRVPPIWYISTSAYGGKFTLAHGGMTDWDKFRFEKELIETVLGRVRHGIAYKPYPAERYLDPDPLFRIVRTHPSVRLVETGVDLRYMVRAARVLVTCRPTSTVSWCLMADRPLVFIDLPGRAPLKPAAREAFQAGTLFFDARQPAFASELRDLLNADVGDIERLWRERAAQRQALIARFVDSGGPGAGKRAAGVIAEKLAADEPKS